MSSKNKKKLKRAFPYIIIAVLLISDLFLLFRTPEEKIVSKTEDFTFYQKCTDLDYNEDKKYYKTVFCLLDQNVFNRVRMIMASLVVQW